MPHLLEYGIDGKRRTVDHHRIVCRLERGHRSGSISLVAFPDAFEKGAETNTQILIFQLLITPSSALFGARFEEDFQRRVGKYHGTHIATVGDQPRRTAKAMLRIKQGRTHRAAARPHATPPR